LNTLTLFELLYLCFRHEHLLRSSRPKHYWNKSNYILRYSLQLWHPTSSTL
jgi:hypothetical protein